MPYIPPPSVRFWCVLCDRPYWYVPGIGTFKTSSYHHHRSRRDRNRLTWRKGLCTEHYDVAKLGLAGQDEIHAESLRVEEYYRKKFGGTWRRNPGD